MQSNFQFTDKIFFPKLLNEECLAENQSVKMDIKELCQFVMEEKWFDSDCLTTEGQNEILRLIAIYKKDSQKLHPLTNWCVNIIAHYLKNSTREYKGLSQTATYAERDRYPLKKSKKIDGVNTGIKTTYWYIKKDHEAFELFGSRLFSLFALSCKNKLHTMVYPPFNRASFFASGKIASKEVSDTRKPDDTYRDDFFVALQTKGSGLAEILLLSLITNEPDLADRNILYNEKMKKFIRIDFSGMFNHHPGEMHGYGLARSNGEDFSFDQLNFDVLYQLPFSLDYLRILQDKTRPIYKKFINELYEAFLKIYLYPRHIIYQLALLDINKKYQFEMDPKKKSQLDDGVKEMFSILDKYFENLKNDPEFTTYLNNRLVNEEEFLADLIYQYSIGEDGHGYARIQPHVNDIKQNVHELKNQFPSISDRQILVHRYDEEKKVDGYEEYWEQDAIVCDTIEHLLILYGFFQNSSKSSIKLASDIGKLFYCTKKGHYQVVTQELSSIVKNYIYDSEKLFELLTFISSTNGESLFDCIYKNDNDNVIQDHIFRLLATVKQGYNNSRFRWAILCHQSSAVLEMLIKDGAIANARDFEVAIQINHHDAIRLAYENKFHKYEKLKFFNGTLLCAAAQEGQADIINLLLNKNANVNDVNINGQTALHYAVLNDHVDIVKFLLEKKGINVNAADKRRKTPLDIAIKEEKIEIVRLLLVHDANVTNDVSDLLPPSNATHSGGGFLRHV